MTIRPARNDHDDSHFIYHLAMSDDVRLVSTRSTLFTFAEHAEWYARRIQDSLIYIIEVDGERAGYVRWGQVAGKTFGQYDGSEVWEVAIAVSPEYRREGLARRALLETQPGGTAVALIVLGNDTSRRLFESCGYKSVGQEERMGRQHARYEKAT